MKTGKIVKENQPRPLPNSGNKTSGKNSANSRRKLEFKEKLPLAGKNIYLDLKGVRQEKKVEEKLQKLGATIEKFLSKEIHYFVTNQDKEKLKNDDQSPNGSPSVPISSPFNSGHTPSPSNLEKKTFSVTRGKAMLQCARMDSAADNIIERAKKLGVKIVPYLSLMKWLIKEQSRNYEQVKEAPPPLKKPKVEDNQKPKKTLLKARNLKQPFIKFESVNKFFRPIQIELKSWPYINMNSAPGICPFDDWLLGVNSAAAAAAAGPSKQETIKQNKQDNAAADNDGDGGAGYWSAESEGHADDVPNILQKRNKKNFSNQSVAAISKTTNGRRLVNWERRKLAEKKLRQGFCECCEMRFDDVKKHLNSLEHNKFVKNETNYRQLDNLITNGYNVQQFISKVSNHPKFYPEKNSSNYLECSSSSSSPGRIVLLTLSSSTSTHVKASAGHAASLSGVKPTCMAMSSESEPATSQNNAPNVSESKTSAGKNPTNPSLVKDATIYMKTPVKAEGKMPGSHQDGSPSPKNCKRSPLKCILNSPSRLDFNMVEKQANKHKGSSVSSLFLPEIQQHSKNGVLMAVDNQNENAQPVKSARYSSPSSQENFSVEQKQAIQSQLKSDCARIQENSSGTSAALPLTPSVTFAPNQTLLNNNGKNSKSPLGNNSTSSESKYANFSLKRNLRCSSSKSKNQRLFKLGEKWQVLSQQSVKKILFSDESQEPFTGFDPQDVFRNSDNSDVSYETISEVILTDPSEFEWVLGTCEGKQVINGVHSDPSSQATFSNSKKNVTFRDLVATSASSADCPTPQQKSLTAESGVKKYVESQGNDNDRPVPFCQQEDGDICHECTEINCTDEASCTKNGVNSESPAKNYGDNEVYLSCHKDYPPYIPNGQTSGYCSPSFQQNLNIKPSAVPEAPKYSAANNFEVKVIQDLDYSQTPRYLHFESVDLSLSHNLENRPANYSPNFQQFPYSDLDYPTNLEACPLNTFTDYPRLFDSSVVQQSCNQASSENPPLEQTKVQQMPTGSYSFSEASTSNYRGNTSNPGDVNQCKRDVFSKTPLPNLSYECSSLSAMSVERTLNESDQNLDTPPDLPLGSSNNNNNNNNNNSFEAIPVLNFDSSFSFPVQNFPILSDFSSPENNEEKRPSFGSGSILKDPEPSAENFQEQSDKTEKSEKVEVYAEETVVNCNDTMKSESDDCKKTRTSSPATSSYSASIEDDKENFSDTICTAETHSLISSLSQTPVSAQFNISEENQRTGRKYLPNFLSEKTSPHSPPVPENSARPNFDKTPEPVLENDIIPQLTLGCELQTSSPLHALPEQGNEDLDMPPQLQFEGPQLPLLVHSPCELSPPKLMPEVALEQESASLPRNTAEIEPCSLVPSLLVHSPLFCTSSSSSSLPSSTEPPLQNADILPVQDDDPFLSLPKYSSSFQDLQNLGTAQYPDNSCLTNPVSNDKHHNSKNVSLHAKDPIGKQPFNTDTNPLSAPFNSTSDQKHSQANFSLLSLSSSLPSSDLNVHGVNSHFKSESEITDPLQKLTVEGMDMSDDAYAISGWKGSKNDRSVDVKDSGFFSVEELTPKKSPSSDSQQLSSNYKILSNIAKPCSVVLEKTPDTLLVHTRFPLQKSVDQQNTFSVKRINNTGPVSPNSNTKPRLLKRLSDNQKTFRLDYIHGGCGGRKNLSRTSVGKTRNMARQYNRLK